MGRQGTWLPASPSNCIQRIEDMLQTISPWCRSMQEKRTLFHLLQSSWRSWLPTTSLQVSSAIEVPPGGTESFPACCFMPLNTSCWGLYLYRRMLLHLYHSQGFPWSIWLDIVVIELWTRKAFGRIEPWTSDIFMLLGKQDPILWFCKCQVRLGASSGDCKWLFDATLLYFKIFF